MKGKIPTTIFLLLWLPLSILSRQERDKPSEYHAKAVFIARVVMFIQWPEKSNMADKSQPFVFGVFGETPLKTWAEKVYSHEKNKIKGKKVKIRYFTTPAEVIDCNLLFIPKSAAEDLPQILSVTKNKPVLTVGDTEGFAEKGVHINLLLKSGKVKYEINSLTLLDSRLRVKFQLYKYASKVVGTWGRSNENR